MIAVRANELGGSSGGEMPDGYRLVSGNEGAVFPGIHADVGYFHHNQATEPQ